MTWNINNFWPDICDFRIDSEVTDHTFETETDLRCELYIGEHEMTVGDQRVNIGFSKVSLQLECHGLDIAIGERYGDNVPSNSIDTTYSNKKSIRNAASVDAGLTISPKTISNGDLGSISAKAGRGMETACSEQTEYTETTNRVNARGNGKWDIVNEKRDVLSAKYLTSDMALCKLRPSENANRVGLLGHLYAHKNDIIVDSPDKSELRFPIFGNKNVNKKKIFETLLNKTITHKEDLDDSNYVQLSIIKSFDNDVE